MTLPKASPALVLGLSCLTAATLIGCALVNRAMSPTPSVRVVLALMPMIPVFLMGWSIVASIRELDELQRRIVLEAIFSAFLAGAFLTLLYGQLQHARIGLPELNWALIWAAMAAPCAVAFIVSARRYQ